MATFIFVCTPPYRHRQHASRLAYQRRRKPTLEGLDAALVTGVQMVLCSRSIDADPSNILLEFFKSVVFTKEEIVTSSKVNNAIYSELGTRWLSAKDDPVALLRAENRARTPWILKTLQDLGVTQGLDVLDLGCGAGFLCRDLCNAGFKVTGLDASEEALQVARTQSTMDQIGYLQGDLYSLPFSDQTFSVVFLMDVLEHLEDPALALKEASRVLKPGGFCFFYTFNRNFMARLLVIKAVEWFVKNVPSHLHVYKYFLKPREVKEMCAQAGMKTFSWRGFGPVIWQRPLLNLLRTGEVQENFAFEFKNDLCIGFVGIAKK